MTKIIITFCIPILFIGCGTNTPRRLSVDASSGSEEIETRISALESLSGSLQDLIQSEFADCTNTGETSDLLIRKICEISQAANSETQALLLSQLGTYSTVLQNQINQLRQDLTNEAVALDTRLDAAEASIIFINTNITNLTTRMTNAENAITALQSSINSLTRVNYVLVKSISDFPGCNPGPCPNPIVLAANTDYEINGIINVAESQFKISDGTQIFGFNNLNDGLTYTGAGSMFMNNAASDSFIIRNIKITASSAAKVFDLTGDSSAKMYVYENNISNSPALGTIATASSIWFIDNESSNSTSMTGLVISGTVGYLNFSNNTFSNSTDPGVEKITLLEITSGTFTAVRVQNNDVISNSAYTNLRAFNITTTPVITDGKLNYNSCSNGLLLSSSGTQISSDLNNWWFYNNSGLADSTFYGSMNVTTTLNNANTLSWVPVRGTFVGDYNERFTVETGILEDTRSDLGGRNNVLLSATPCGTGGYVVGDLLTITADGSGYRIRVGNVDGAGRITALDYTTASYLPGKDYVTGNNKATAYYDGVGAGTGCTLDVDGTSGRLIYAGLVAKRFRVNVQGSITHGSSNSARTVNMAIYRGSGTGAPSILADSQRAVSMPNTAGYTVNISTEETVVLAPNDYVEAWTSALTDGRYKVADLYVSISEL